MSNRSHRTSAPPGGSGRTPDAAEPLLAGSAAALLAAMSVMPGEAAASAGIALLPGLAWLLLLAALLTLRWRRGVRVAISWDWPLLLLLACLAWQVLSATVMSRHGNARASANMLWLAVSTGACLMVLFSLAARPQVRRALAAVMIALAAGQAGHGLFQYFVGMPRLVAQYYDSSEVEKRELLTANGVDWAVGSPGRTQFEDRLRSTEPYASFGLANSLAGVLVTWMVLSCGLPLSGALEARGAARQRDAFALSAAAVMGACLVLTKSRTAWLAGVAGVLVLVVWDVTHQRRLGWKLPLGVALFAVLVAVAAAAAGALDQQVISEAWLSLGYRLQYWSATWQLMGDHPWLGCGPGNFQDYYPQYKLATASETVADPHNFALEVAATAGLPAAALLLGAILWWIVRAVRTAGRSGHTARSPQENDGREAAGIWIGAAVGLVCGPGVAALYGYSPETLADHWPIPVAWVTGGICLALAAWLLEGWIRAGELPAEILLAALAALLLNLLAAGGIGFPGVAQGLWLLLALLAAETGARVWTLSRGAALGALVGVLGLAALMQLTAVRPVLLSQAALSRAQAARPEEAERLALQAAAADQRAAEPWRMLALLRLQRWRQQQTIDRWRSFTAAIDEAVRRDARSHTLYTQIGRWHLQAYDLASQQEHWEAAVEAYRQAAELYPSAISWARLAWALHLGGADEEARRWADASLARDEQHPHREQKLDRQSLWTSAEPLNAEQAMQKLRMGGQS